MKVKQLCSGTFNSGITNNDAVRLENTAGNDTIVVQFDNGGNSGDMILQGRLTTDALWVTVSTDSAGAIQLVAALTEWRIRINNTTGGPADYKCWIGG